MENKQRKLWDRPWGYAESAVLISVVISAGWLMQFMVGSVNFLYLSWPVNGFIGVIIILIIVIFSLLRNTAVFRWISGVQLSVCLISALVILGVIMGLFPQFRNPAGEDIIQKIGFTSMTSSWPFVMVYFITLVSLGCVIVKRIAVFKRKDISFILNHAGLWILLFSAGIGSADIRRYVMHIREGDVEWRVYNEGGGMLELPLAIELNDFDMEVYPPKLAVIDRVTGDVQPLEKPAYFNIDEKKPVGTLGDWELSIEEYIHSAVRNSDSTYREVRMPGATPAVRLKVRNVTDGNVFEGWVCSGNMAQLYMVLNLGKDYGVVMTKPEPKKFISDINIYTPDGRTSHAMLEVNKPARVGCWRLYQYGYDTDAGRMSTYSSIELVYDPWVIPVYIGISMLAAGSVCMIWSGRRKEDNDDLG